jgi:hypothetical protein
MHLLPRHLVVIPFVHVRRDGRVTNESSQLPATDDPDLEDERLSRG